MRYTRNTWTGGRNSDTNKSIIQPNQYLEAHNVEIVADSNFYALQNIKGTTYLKEIINDSSAEEIGAFYTKYLIGGNIVQCITYFVIRPPQFFIWCYDIENNNLYDLYQEGIADDYNTDDRVIDAINYPENGVDYLYFTDNYNDIRFIKCEIPDSYSANFLTEFDISLQRKGAVGQITLTAVASGGNLLSGTYQFAYRTCDPTKKRFTKWSAITNPVHVYDAINSNNVIHAGVGLLTDRKITLSITPSPLEAANLGYIQLAVLENVASTPPTTASLLEYTAFSTSLTFDYKANTRIGTISLDELTVDLAQIDHVKSLRVSNNRLFGGNTTYVNLVPENNPIVNSGTVITNYDSSNTDAFSGDDFASRYIGYWGGEVYRFGVVYEDEDGNKSSAIPLDLSGVTYNQIFPNTLTDIKFPDRSVSNSWTLFNSSGKIQTKGLRLTTTHQITWAKKIHIVRMARKKNILFQTPVIPMMGVQGLGAFGNYPTNYINQFGNATNTSAQPQTQAKILIPKNLFWPELRGLEPIASATNTGQIQINDAGQQGYAFSQIFPAPDMYGDTPFVFTGVEKLDFIDRALVKLNYTTFDPTKSPTAVVDGDDVNTNISGMFYAVSDGDYYFDSTWTAKSITDTNIALTDYAYFDNLGQPTSVAGVSTFDYGALQTQGVSLGYQPSVPRCAVVKMGTTVADLNNSGVSYTFANGRLNPFVSGGEEIISGSGLHYETPNVNVSNKYINLYGSGLTNNSYVNAISIANVKLNLNDNRYGDLNAFHEYQYTGSSYTFNDSEVTTLESGGSVTVSNLDIWGGDCFVGPQIFKVCDSTYSITNQIKISTGTSEAISTTVHKWVNPYGVSSVGYCMPVAVENAGQYLTVVLESDYNGEVRDYDTLTSVVTTVNGIPILNNSSKDTIRTPLSYKYNLNLSRQNNQKIFESKLQYSFTQTEFKARVPYSNIKIYNSDQAGFDVWSVGDFVDLPEQRYAITGLAVAGDALYALQEKGVVYLPIGERQIEQTDASTLAVRTGDVIGRPLIIDAKRGCQHLRGIVETGNVVYFPDNINKTVYKLAGTELRQINDDNQSVFRSIFDTTLTGKSVKGCYDFVNSQYWLIAGGSVQIYSENLPEKPNWIGDIEFVPYSAVYVGDIFVTGKQGSSLRIYSMTDPTLPVTLFGTQVTPRVTFVINPDGNFSKTFDVLMVAATDRLESADAVVENESALGNQTVTGINFDVPSVEGNFRVPTPRDSNGFRLRGLRALLTFKWGNLRSALQAVETKYDLSKRIPF